MLTMINISEEYTSWNNRLKVEMKKRLRIRVNECAVEREGKVKCHSSVPVESQCCQRTSLSWNPGRLSSEGKCQIFSQTVQRDQRPKRAWSDQTGVTARPATSSTLTCTIFGMANALGEACEELRARREYVTWIDKGLISFVTNKW